MKEKIKITCDGAELRSIDSFSEFQGKFKTLSKDKYESLKKEMVNRGFAYPFFVWKDKIFDGHQRFEVIKRMKKEGYEFPEKFPVINVEAKDEKELAEKLIAFNQNIGDISPTGLIEFIKNFNIDFDYLKDYELPGIDMNGIAKMIKDADRKSNVDEDACDDAEKITNPVSKKGSLYALGKHRVMCSDCTDVGNIGLLFGNKKADVVLTDPPYAITMGGGGIFGPNMVKTTDRIKDIIDFKPEKFLSTVNLYFNGNMNAFFFCNKELLPDYINWSIKNGYNFNLLVWCKTGGLCPMTGGHHFSDIEYIVYCSKKPIFNNSLKDVSYRKYFTLTKERSEDHPTVKPQEILQNEIKICSKFGGIVSDPFLGSGSTLIASEVTGRVCYGFEIDERYCDVIRKRYAEFVHGAGCDWQTLTPEVEKWPE